MIAPAQDLEESVKKKRTFVAQAPRHAKTRRLAEAADYWSLGPLPPQVNMPECQVHRLVPWSRSNRCKFVFWTAGLAKVCSHLRLVQTNWFQGQIHCRVESQKRDTPHLHCLCYVPRNGLELPPPDGSYRAALKRLRMLRPRPCDPCKKTQCCLQS